MPYYGWCITGIYVPGRMIVMESLGGLVTVLKAKWIAWRARPVLCRECGAVVEDWRFPYCSEEHADDYAWEHNP